MQTKKAPRSDVRSYGLISRGNTNTLHLSFRNVNINFAAGLGGIIATVMWRERMGRHIIYVDGSVGVGKSTFIGILERTFRSVFEILDGNGKATARRSNVEVLPEPLHRDWTNHIVAELGYQNLLHFLLARKIAAIESWSTGVASDGLQELENNVLIVERSLGGDRRVNADCEDLFDGLDVRYTGESVHHILIHNHIMENDEQMRLNLLYNSLELETNRRAIHRFVRPRFISTYHKEAAQIVQAVLGI